MIIKNIRYLAKTRLRWIASAAAIGTFASVALIKPMYAEPTKPISSRMEALVKKLQKDLVSAIEEIEGEKGSKFMLDRWKRAEGGEGISAVLQEGNNGYNAGIILQIKVIHVSIRYFNVNIGKVFEKAGVNVSIIASPAPPAMLLHMRARKLTIDTNKKYNMFVAGISTVMHPHNPMAPTFHANYRYFELREEGLDEGMEPTAAWFGGGCDLTPSYLFEEDAVNFHKVIKTACDKHDVFSL